MSQAAAASIKSSPLGNQLIVDFYECDCENFDDLEWVENVMIEAANRARASIVDVVFHKFNPMGISGVVVISESHFAIHTWPEHRYAAIDVFTCGDMLDSEAAIAHLASQFGCRKRNVTKVFRGELDNLARNPYAGIDDITVGDRLAAVKNLSSKNLSVED